jgi:tetratricopeptide (TPR) repeat protein
MRSGLSKRSTLGLIVIAMAAPALACFSEICPSQTTDAPSRQFAEALQQKLATVALQVTLAGNLRDFSVQQPESDPIPKQMLARYSEEYRQSVDRDPANADLHYRFSLFLVELGDTIGARAELQNAIHLDPNLKRARNQLGILSLSGDRAASESELRSAMAGDSKLVESKNNLGALFALEGKYIEAAEFLRDATSDRPTYAEAHVNLGYVFMALGNHSDAEKEFREALYLRPNYVTALNALGMVSLKLGRGQDAVEILQRVVHARPDSAPAHANLGMALAADGFDLAGALEQFSTAIRLDPSSSTLYYARGRILNDLKRPEEARADLETACRLRPDYFEALYLLAEIERQLGNVQRSADLLKNVVRLEPDNADAQLSLGRNLVSLGRFEEAVQHLRKAVELSPDNADVLYNLAQALNKMGSPEAKSYLERFRRVKQQIETDDRIQHLGSYGLEAAANKDWSQAIADFKEAIKLCDRCTALEDLHRNLGLIYVLHGDVEEGKRELQTALQMKPTDLDARRALESLPKDAPR